MQPLRAKTATPARTPSEYGRGRPQFAGFVQFVGSHPKPRGPLTRHHNIWREKGKRLLEVNILRFQTGTKTNKTGLLSRDTRHTHSLCATLPREAWPPTRPLRWLCFFGSRFCRKVLGTHTPPIRRLRASKPNSNRPKLFACYSSGTTRKVSLRSGLGA